MSREIKFRAYCTGTHRNLTFTNSFMDYDVILSPHGYYCDVENRWDIHGEYDSVPIMQFTGEKDKNGKEVFEGDIVKVKELSHVGFEDNIGTFETEPNPIYEDLVGIIEFKEGAFFLEEYPLHSFIDLNFEVIGNIYENPELL